MSSERIAEVSHELVGDLASISGDTSAQTNRTPQVVLGVTGGIAAYKATLVLRLLKAAGCDVRVVPTDASLKMVARTTWEALSGHPVYTQVTEGATEVAHVSVGEHADLLLIVPATANTMAKLAAGIADNMLTATALVVECPVMIAPAMHTQMWNNAATQANISVLRDRGIHFVGPAVGRLTGKDSGIGRMSEPEEIASAALDLLRSRGFLGAAAVSDVEPSAWSGRKLAISAGGTHEQIDPVRFIGNRSTGRMGVELARAAANAGAEVHLAAANIGADVLAELPDSVHVHPVTSARDLLSEMDALAQEADVVIMTAAVADFRPETDSESKIKKDGSGSGLTLRLVENPDILADLARNRRRENQIVIGFAAETGDEQHSVIEYGKAKAARKGADAIVINAVGVKSGFGDVDTEVTIVNQAGDVLGTAEGTKRQVAAGILESLGSLLPGLSI